MLGTASYDPCHGDCAPFDRQVNLFCVKVGERILIGSRKADWRWRYDATKMFEFVGKQVSLRYDDHSIWLVRTDGKDLFLDRRVSYDRFADPRCSAATRSQWLSLIGSPPRPASVPTDAVIVPQGDQDFRWMKCTYDSLADADRCVIWSSGGFEEDRLHPGEWGDKTDGKAVPPDRLLIDPLSTLDHFEIHLKDGTILKRR